MVKCTAVSFCRSLLLTVLLPQHGSFTGHSLFWGWPCSNMGPPEAAVPQSIPLSSGVLPSMRPSSVMSPRISPSTFLLLFLQTYLFTSLLMGPFWTVLLCLLSFLLLVSPAPSSCPSSLSIPEQRHCVLLCVFESLGHDGLFPSFSESSGTCYDWHRAVCVLLPHRHPTAPVTKPCRLCPIQSLTN